MTPKDGATCLSEGAAALCRWAMIATRKAMTIAMRGIDGSL